jgi:hypothetical protein
MNKAMKVLRIIGSAMLFAIIIFALAAAPGFLSDSSSTVPIGTAAGIGR